MFLNPKRVIKSEQKLLEFEVVELISLILYLLLLQLKIIKS